MKELIPFEIEDLFPSNALGGAESGCMSLRAKETSQLVDAQKRLNEELYQLFGSCPAEHDDDYVFHMTFAIGGAGYESYQRAYDALIKIDYKQTFRFDAFLFGKWMHLLLFADRFRFQVDTALKNIYFGALRSFLYRLSMQIAPKGAVMRMDKTATVNTVCPQANPIASVIERLRIGWEDVPGRLGAQREKI